MYFENTLIRAKQTLGKITNDFCKHHKEKGHKVSKDYSEYPNEISVLVRESENSSFGKYFQVRKLSAQTLEEIKFNSRYIKGLKRKKFYKK